MRDIELLIETVAATVPVWFWLIATGAIALFILGSIGDTLLRRRRRQLRENAFDTQHTRSTVAHELPTHSRYERNYFKPNRLGDPSSQLEYISRVELAPKRLLHPAEFEVFQLLEQVAAELQAGHRVMAQTSMGEIIRTPERSGSPEERDLAYRSINSKRLDFLVIDSAGWPVLGVEYQGRRHDGRYSDRVIRRESRDDTLMRNTVKERALARAGIRFLEVQAEYDKEKLKTRICSELETPIRSELSRNRAPDKTFGRTMDHQPLRKRNTGRF